MADDRDSPMMRAARAAGRAVVGAFAGLIWTTVALHFASERFQLVTFREPATGDPRFLAVLTSGVVATAGLAVGFGRASFSNRVASILRGMAYGAALGAVGGPLIGRCLGNPKAGHILGIFLGVPTASLVGGILGFENDRLARRRRLAEDPGGAGPPDREQCPATTLTEPPEGPATR